MNRAPKAKGDVAQAKRFIDAAREAGCSEDEAEFDANLKRIGAAKPRTPKKGDDHPKSS